MWNIYSATVANLQQKVEQLTTTNALMKEDLAIARNSLLTLQAENAALRQNQNGSRQVVADNQNVLDRFDPEMAETLAEERRKRQDSERELELQVCLKAETDMAMKLLEKDIHEKQDTIVSLRRQLEDIKQINLEMYKKLQVIALRRLCTLGNFSIISSLFKFPPRISPQFAGLGLKFVSPNFFARASRLFGNISLWDVELREVGAFFCLQKCLTLLTD